MAGASPCSLPFCFESISMAVDEIKEPCKNAPRLFVLEHSDYSLYFGDLGLTGLTNYALMS